MLVLAQFWDKCLVPAGIVKGPLMNEMGVLPEVTTRIVLACSAGIADVPCLFCVYAVYVVLPSGDIGHCSIHDLLHSICCNS